MNGIVICKCFDTVRINGINHLIVDYEVCFNNKHRNAILGISRSNYTNTQ